MKLFGWIKLHRQITGWKWYGDGNTVRVFLHLLLSCPPGEDSCRVSVRKIAEDLAISHKECRLAISRLLNDGTIAARESSTGRGGATTFGIANWKKFQQGTFKPIENQGLTTEKGTFKGTKKGTNKGTNKGTFKPIENQGLTTKKGTFKGTKKGTKKGTNKGTFKGTNKGTFKPIENQGLTTEDGHINEKKGTFKGTFKGTNKGTFKPIENQGLTTKKGTFKGTFKGTNKGTPSLKNKKERLDKTRADAHGRAREENPETPASPLTTGFPLPKSVADVQMVATDRGILMTDEELQDFFDWHTARGWRDAQGFQFHDWRFLLRGWVAHRKKTQTNTGDNNGDRNSRAIRNNGGQIGQNFSGDDYGEADDYAPIL